MTPLTALPASRAQACAAARVRKSFKSLRNVSSLSREWPNSTTRGTTPPLPSQSGEDPGDWAIFPPATEGPDVRGRHRQAIRFACSRGCKTPNPSILWFSSFMDSGPEAPPDLAFEAM